MVNLSAGSASIRMIANHPYPCQYRPVHRGFCLCEGLVQVNPNANKFKKHWRLYKSVYSRWRHTNNLQKANSSLITVSAIRGWATLAVVLCNLSVGDRDLYLSLSILAFSARCQIPRMIRSIYGCRCIKYTSPAWVGNSIPCSVLNVEISAPFKETCKSAALSMEQDRPNKERTQASCSLPSSQRRSTSKPSRARNPTT